MPYKIVQHGDKFSVVAQNTGRVAGTHESKAKAQAQMAALYANEPEARGEKVIKSEGGYKPTSGMKAAAHKAIKFKEDGKANGAGTNVGWTRAHQIVNGESLSLDTVKRMFSFFSRHEVDKKGENWGSQSDPSNGYIMWLAWGGDAGFSWSRAICNREKKTQKNWDVAFSPIQKNDEIDKCMTCGCEDLGNDHHYISDTEKCLSCFSKGQGPCWDGYEYAGTKEQDGKTVPNCVPESKKKVNKSVIAGGSDWSIEFSTPDCQHGWSILKGGTAQSIGCYLTKEEAEQALEGLKNEEINILGQESQAAQTPNEIADKRINKSSSFWDGIFIPTGEALSGTNFGSIYQDARYYFPAKASYENDGKPSAGYGNRSSNNTTP